LTQERSRTRELTALYAGLALLVAASLGVYWTGNASTPLWDRDEPRFAEAAREMLHSGDFIVPRFNGAVRFDKPILGYYPMAAGMYLFGGNEFGARFFSGVFGALSIIVMFFLARRIMGHPRQALLAAAVLATSPVMMVESKLCTVDALLLFLLLLSFYGLWRIYEGPCGRGWAALFWAALALAVLTKGPVALAAVFVPAAIAAVAVRDRSFLRRMGWAWGVPLFLVILAPWLAAVQARTGGEFLRVALGRHVVERAQGALEGHKGFPGFYVVTLFGTFFPWAFLIPAAVWSAARGLRDKREQVFLIAWAAGLIIVLELVKTKMVHYSLPIFPALSILVASLFYPRGARRDAIFKAIVVALVLSEAGAAAAPVAAYIGGLAGVVVPLVVAGAAAFVGLAFWAFAVERGKGAGIGVVTVFVWMFLLAAWAAPALGNYALSQRLAAIVKSAEPAGAVREEPGAQPSVALYGYEEPSLVFYLGRHVAFPRNPKDAAEIAAPGAPRVLVVSGREQKLLSLLESLPREAVTRVGEARGFNFAKGRHEAVTVWRVGE